MTKIKVVTGSERGMFDKLKVKFAPGSFIFQEGELGTTMFIIQKGSVEIRKNIGGAEQVLSILEKGDFFGEMSILEGSPRSATAHAMDEVEVIEIDEATFDHMLRSNQEIAIRMLRKLSAKLRHTTKLLEQLAGRSVTVDMPKVEAPVKTVEFNHQLVSDENPEIKFPVHPTGETVIGRKDPVTGFIPDIDIGPLDKHRAVSRRHAKLMVMDGELFLKEDVGTMNGTYLNGKQVPKGKPTPIKAGDSLQFATVVLRLEVV